MWHFIHSTLTILQFYYWLPVILLIFFLFQPAAAKPLYPRLGVNVAGIHQLAHSMPFTDIFKVTSGWYTSCEYDWLAKKPVDPGCTRENAFNTHEQSLLELDKNGWVRRLPAQDEEPVFTSVVSAVHLDKDFPLGRYVLLYSGKGEIEVSGALNIIEKKPGRIEFDLFATERGLKIKISKTHPRRYIKDIHLLALEDEKHFRNHFFDKNYLEKLRPFDVIRFMPWSQPRSNQLKHWKQRPGNKYAHYTGKNGVPIEIMLELVKQINASPWLTIPYQADDDFIRRYAYLVRKQLKGRQKIYIEYSNEVWNVIFPANQFAFVKASALWPFAYQHEKPYKRRVKLASNWYAKRSVEVCRIWKKVFGRQAHRVICVISAQSNVKWVGQEVLDCPLWIDRNCGLEMDAYAVNAYFGDYIARKEYRPALQAWLNADNSRDSSAATGRLFKELGQGGALPAGPEGGAIQEFIDNKIKVSIQLADDYGLPLLAYEAGQHLIRYDPPHKINDPKLLEFFMRANQDSRMKEIYQRYLRAWEENGGKTLMHFYAIGKPTPTDSFSMLPSKLTESAPKYDALLRYLRHQYKDSFAHTQPLSLKQLRQRKRAAHLQSRAH